MADPAIKLSIVIPVFNAEQYLKQCLDSVLEQSLGEIEVICVDDGSTDGSLAMLREYEKRDARVKVLTQENMHAGVARNNGLSVATGEYVHFLDADDYVLPYAYEAIYNKAKKYDLDMIRFAAVCWNETRGVFEDNRLNTLSELRPGDFNRLVGTEAGSPLYKVGVTPWAGMYRRTFLVEKGIRFNDLTCCNDRSFFAAVLTNSARTMISRDRLVFHRTGQAGSLLGIRAENFDCHFRSIEHIADRLNADAVDMEAQERILLAEFNELFAEFSGLCRDTEQDQATNAAIKEKTERFVENYSRAFAYALQNKYRDTLGKLASYKAPAPFNETKPFREACEKPKVSVIVPTYNVEDYLNEALNSLTTQQLDDMEFVCINDGSTDGSLTILKEYAALDKRFVILDGPNGGYGKGMNRGMDAARGEYMGILEPDDFVPQNMFKELYEKAKSNDLDFVKADFKRFTVNADGSLNEKPFKLARNKSYYNRVLRPIDEQATFLFVMNTWSGIYKLDFLRKHNIRHNETPGASYQDNGFWAQTFCHADRAMFVDKSYYMNRRDNPNSSMFSSGKMMAVTEEYRFIREKLQNDPVLWAKFERIYWKKKLDNFFVTLYRLRPELQDEYVHHMHDEFKGVYEKGLLDEEFVGKSNWSRFTKIMSDPDNYLKDIRVSVIIPVYNAEKWLNQTLDSILVRNEIPFEVICVDDGSTDGSLEILRDYEARDPRVKVLTQANAGAGAARNAGLAIARGEYLSFLDADDFFEPDMLRTAYDRAKVTDADVVVFRCDKYIEESGKYEGAQYTIKSDLLPKEEPFAGADIERDVFKAFVGWPWDKLFRAEFVRENGLLFQNTRTTNDMLFVFSALLKAERIATSNTVLAHHRRAKNTLSVTREVSWGCFYEALLALREQLRTWNIYEIREQDFINYSLHFALWQVNSLHGQAYHDLYDKLKNEWFADLGVTAHGMDYFYNRGEWKQLQQIMALSSDEFLSWRIEDLQSQLNRVRANLNKAKENVKKLDAGTAKRKGIPAFEELFSARIDIKNEGNPSNDVEIVEISDVAASVTSPQWLKDLGAGGGGLVVTSRTGDLSVRLKTKGKGNLSITLRGADCRIGEKRIPVSIDYTEMSVDGKIVFEGLKRVSHDKKCVFSQEATDGQIVDLHVKWVSDNVYIGAGGDLNYAELMRIKNSRSFKLANMIALPVRFARKLITGKAGRA